jgi:hypothetical protein
MVWVVVVAVVIAALVVGSQIFTSAVRYRRTMRSEWPKVEPRPDDWED